MPSSASRAADHSSTISPDDKFVFEISSNSEDRAWDEYLAATPGGDHVQSSMWASVKLLSGWQCRRILVRSGGVIVGGAQLLLRRVALGFSVGYIPAGPICTRPDAGLYRELIRLIFATARRNLVFYLVVHPPRLGPDISDVLKGVGFLVSPIDLIPTATMVLDLSRTEEALLAGMSKNRRQSIRNAIRDGRIVVREASESDLAILYALLISSGKRKQFSQESDEVLQQMWRVFSKRGMARATIAEVDREPVAMQFAIRFGDTFYLKRKGWSGKYGNLSVNELLHWEMMQWHKGHGCRYCDVEGIDGEMARAILLGEPCSYDWHRGPDYFKYEFGGQIVLSGGAYEFIPIPLLRWAVRTLFPRIRSWSSVRHFMAHLRGR